MDADNDYSSNDDDDDYSPSESDEDEQVTNNTSAICISENIKSKSIQIDNDAKKRIDDLWAGFLTKDCKNDQRISKQISSNKISTANRSLPSKDIPSSSSQVQFVTMKHKDIGKLFNSTDDSRNDEQIPVDKTIIQPLKRLGTGILISAALKELKKPKLTTLKKSSLDWTKFKDEEGIHEDLESHNKGKYGYLQREDFLRRTDSRQFDSECDARNALRKNK